MAFKVDYTGGFFFFFSFNYITLSKRCFPIPKPLKKLFAFCTRRSPYEMRTNFYVATVVGSDGFRSPPSRQRRPIVATSPTPLIFSRASCSFPSCELKSIIGQRTVNISSEPPNRTICTRLNAVPEKPSKWPLIRTISPGYLGISSVR